MSLTTLKWLNWAGNGLTEVFPQYTTVVLIVNKDMKISAFLSRGRFSVVKRCDHHATKRTVAVKQVNKKLMRRDRVTQELNLLQRLQHPHIISLMDTYETPSSYVLVLEM